MKKARYLMFTLIIFSIQLNFAWAENTSINTLNSYKELSDRPFGTKIYYFGVNNQDGATFGQVTPTAIDKVGSALLPPCSASVKTTCIDYISYSLDGEKTWKLAKLASDQPGVTNPPYFNSKGGGNVWGETTYSPFYVDSRTGLPLGGYSTIWEMPGAEHGGGNKYLASVSYDFYEELPENGSSRSQAFLASLAPIKIDETSNKFWPPGTRYQFPQNVSYRIAINMGNLKSIIGNWFNSRMEKPSIEINNDELVITGAPTWSEIASTGPLTCDKWHNASPQIIEACKNQDLSFLSMFGNNFFGNSLEGATTPNLVFPNGSYNYFESQLKPIGSTSIWNANSLMTSSIGGCNFGLGKYGLAASNAMLYSTLPPKWDSNKKILSYGMASTHLKSTGEINKGNFYLQIPRAVASCLWGNSATDPKAEISVTYPDNTIKAVATTVFKSNSEYFYISASGYTFSQSVAQIKLIPQSNKLAKNSLSCTNGKNILQLISKKSQCPKGYKQINP